VLDDRHVFELAMVENLQREDLNAIDKASAFRQYLSNYGGTQEELASRLGVDRSTVSNLIRLLDLPGEVLDAVRSTEISQGHARALLGLPDAESQVAACKRIVTQHLSVRQTEALVISGAPTPPRPRIRKDPAHQHDARPPHLLDVEQRLVQSLGARVMIRPKGPDGGQIIIDYQSRQEFDRLAALFQNVGP
jgi:ParB family chromosome partitioning protein